MSERDRLGIRKGQEGPGFSIRKGQSLTSERARFASQTGSGLEIRNVLVLKQNNHDEHGILR